MVLAVGLLGILEELAVVVRILVVIAVTVPAAVLVPREVVAVLDPLLSYPLSNIPLPFFLL